LEEPRVRHHYVPQFYLKQFARDQAEAALYVVDLETRRSFTTGTRAIALERHFHTIEVAGQPSDIVERALADFEGSVAAALSHILNRGFLGGDADAQTLLFFATLLLLKNPAVRAKMDDAVNTFMKMVGKAQASNAEAFAEHITEMMADGSMPADTDVDALRGALLEGSHTISMATGGHLQNELENAHDLYPFVVGRNWHFLIAKAGQFITSDRPVVLNWANPQTAEPPGLALKGSRVLFPLAPTVAINGGLELSNQTIELDRGGVARINGRIIRQARRQIYARDDGFEYQLKEDEEPRSGCDLANDKRLIPNADDNE